jgi:predicted metal-dependent hydrolase
MNESPDLYEPRYLAGIVLFNREDFFEAHEVWESLWQDCCGPERKFYQALIQAAVALCHFGNGNLRGAVKLYRSSRDYMNRYGSFFLGLDVEAFWHSMAACFAEALAEGSPDRRVPLPEDLIPRIALAPEPESWPDPSAFLEPED